MENTVKERVEIFLKAKKISKTNFGKAIGASNAFVSSMRKSIGPDKLQSIASAYPDLNIEWLLTGEGQMLKPQTANSVSVGSVSGNGNNFVAGNNNNIGIPREEDVETIEGEEVEIKETVILTPEILTAEGIDIKKELKAGTLEAEVKPTQDVLPTHHAKVYTETDEMSPEIEANDPVFVRFLSNKRDFIDGRMYFVDLDNGSVVRWVVGIDSDNIRLISMKDERTVPFDRVRSISEVVAITKRPKTLPKHRITMEDVIAHKDSQIDMVNSQIDTVLEQQSRLIGIIEGQLKKE